MFNKENQVPKKQGVLYAISTGKNNGVYLPKDISHNNHKSLCLLTKQAQSSHKSYVDTLRLVEKQKQNQLKFNKNLIQVQNFSCNYQFSLKCLGVLKNTVNQNGIISRQLKGELQRLKNQIIHQNNQLQQAALPALKSLKQKIKQNKEEQMANYSKIHRQLQKIEQCFCLVSSGIKECQRKLQKSQQNYQGV